MSSPEFTGWIAYTNVQAEDEAEARRAEIEQQREAQRDAG